MNILRSPKIMYEKPELKFYRVNFTLNRLVPGVDNIHYDVHLSHELSKSTTNMVRHLLARYSEASEFPDHDEKQAVWMKARDEFKANCADVMIEAINKAKLEREIQIDYLVQAAIAKMFIEEIQHQFKNLVEHYKNIIRKHEVSYSRGKTTIIKLREELTTITNKRTKIIQSIAAELFQYFSDVQKKNTRKIREANFGEEPLLPENFFSNPILHIGNTNDDRFMIDAYVLFGNRIDDPLKYDMILSLLRNYFMRLIPDSDQTSEDVKENETFNKNQSNDGSMVDYAIKWVSNIDLVFNCFQVEERFAAVKKQKNRKSDKIILKKQLRQRKNQLNRIYRIFKENNLISGIAASYEMMPLYLEYCPPLFPLEVLKYIVMPKTRNSISIKLKHLTGSSGRAISIRPLKKIIKNIKHINKNKKQKYLIKFLKGFACYHRDLQNFTILKEAMNWINLTKDPTTLNLSRVNHTLYEFLLPREKVFEERPIVNHVIIKTDLRGSTDITHQIKERGLNPASYFSLNFFNPITAILPEYGASKVFIEGDAIILSIFEKEETPTGWYSVARACGLAINMLMITQRYNLKNKKHRFPPLEQGIGVCFRNSPPTFLLDGEKRIMISPAINLADRLSSNTKSLRKIFSQKVFPFNLYVFQTISKKDMGSTIDDLFARHNLNGIELNEDGFKKLKEEINLKKIKCKIPDLTNEECVFHTGIFPTVTGKYQRLVIREANIPKVSPEDLSIIKVTPRKYYEVCSNPKLYEHIKKIVRPR